MYPVKPSVFVCVEVISDLLEGAIRPGHFRGVATVVAKLFHIVTPHKAYFGQKDFQQCAVIKRMVIGLNLDVEVIVLPTVREADGLAMSSRNSYLDPGQRQKATCLFRALRLGEELITSGVREPEKIRQKMRAVLMQEKGIEIDYVEVADPDRLAPLERLEGGIVLLIAVRLGGIRLIDNLLLLC
jgi:pantoate--beta-alanine ligase